MAKIIGTCTLLLGLAHVRAHGYLTSPKSRNYVAREEGEHYCPHCLNGGTVNTVSAQSSWGWPYPETSETAVRHGLCGDPSPAVSEQHFMEGGKFADGRLMGTFEAGSVIPVEFTITAHHKGHVEFSLCDRATLSDPEDPITQDCLNEHKLTVVANPDGLSFSDPAFPERYYLPPTCAGSSSNPDTFYPGSYTYKALVQLPMGLQVCDHCVLQWYYVTANSCNPPGYNQTNFPASTCGEWWNPSLSDCLDPEAPYPEEFWNCADIEVVSSGPPTPTAPTTAPPPTTAPVPTPEPAPEPEDCLPEWADCQGGKCCQPGLQCVKHDQWWSQCLQSDATPQPTGTTTPMPTPMPQPTPQSPTPAGPSTSCWKRHWDWPNDYCTLKLDCAEWEMNYAYSGSWESCCNGHCDGTGLDQHGSPTTSPLTAGSPTATAPTSASSPTSASFPTSASSPTTKRMVAYVENWLKCPTDAQLAEYTHIIYSFAVTYTWTPYGNNCNAECILNKVDACRGESVQSFLARAHQNGVQVLLSVGGAGMGGLWDLSTNRCWDTCWDEPASLASQAVEQVNYFGFDGVDVDYEYLLETQQQQDFLVDLTLELRRLLPSGSLLTHAPMDYTLNQGEVYYQLLEQMGPALDFLMPQYYNGHLNAVTSESDLDAALVHFGHLAHAMGDDASKVVFGFCLHDCLAWNAGQERAAAIVDRLESTFPDNGGVFFWAASGDGNGAWPRRVQQQQQH